MAGFLDDAEIEIPCANCNRKTKKSIGWIKGNSQFACACGTVISLRSDQFNREITNVEASIRSLQDSLKKFNH